MLQGQLQEAGHGRVSKAAGRHGRVEHQQPCSWCSCSMKREGRHILLLRMAQVPGLMYP